MKPLFLFGTLRWADLLTAVAGRPVACRPARLEGWRIERSAAGDWPVLVPGGAVDGLLTEPLEQEVRDRLDWYEVVFGYGFEPVEVMVYGQPVTADVYREAEGGAGGAGIPWDLDAWIATHGERTLIASDEVMRARGVQPPELIAAHRKVIHARAHGMMMGRATRRPVSFAGVPDVSDVDVQEIRYPYEGFHRVEEWILDHRRYDGGRSGPIQRAISHVTDAATVLPYDPVRERVLVVEQIRVGALAKRDPHPWMIEPVAGLIDAGETPESTALRECAEEAGLDIAPDNLHFVARYYPSPGGLAQVLHSYVALADLPDDIGGLHGLEEEAEDIRAHVLPLDQLVEMIATGEAANAPLIVSAQWLALHRTRLRLNG